MQQFQDSYEEDRNTITQLKDNIANNLQSWGKEVELNQYINKVNSLQRVVEQKDKQIKEAQKFKQFYSSEKKEREKQKKMYQDEKRKNLREVSIEKITNLQSQLKDKQKELVQLYLTSKQKCTNLQLSNMHASQKKELNKKISQLEISVLQKNNQITIYQDLVRNLTESAEKLHTQRAQMQKYINSIEKTSEEEKLQAKKYKKNLQLLYNHQKEQLKRSFQERQQQSTLQLQSVKKTLQDQIAFEREHKKALIERHKNDLKQSQQKIDSLQRQNINYKISINSLKQEIGLLQMTVSNHKQLQQQATAQERLVAKYKQDVRKLQETCNLKIAETAKKMEQQRKRQILSMRKYFRQANQNELALKGQEIKKAKQDLGKEKDINKKLQNQIDKINGIHFDLETTINQKEDLIKQIFKLITGESLQSNQELIICGQIAKHLQSNKSQKLSLQNNIALSSKTIKELQSQNRQIERYLKDFCVIIQNQEKKELLSPSKKYVLADKGLQQAINKLTKELFQNIQLHKDYFDKSQETKDKLTRERQSLITLNEQLRTKLSNNMRQTQVKSAQQIKTKQSLQSKVLLLQKQLKEQKEAQSRLKEQIIKLQAESIDLKQQISALQTVTIPNFRISLENAQNKISKLQGQLKRYKFDLDQLSRGSEETLLKNKTQNEALTKKAREQIESYSQQLRELTSEKEIQWNRLRQAIYQIYEVQIAPKDPFDKVIETLRENSKSKLENLIVSPIMSVASKQRANFNAAISKFLRGQKFTTTFLYKYDDFTKNFSNYLPTVRPYYDFVIIVKLKSSVIFGVICSGIGSGSRATAINATSDRSFSGEQKSISSTNFDGSFLVIGQGEIRFRNNSNLEVVVNSRIYSTRYFSFKKEELVGTNADNLSVDAMEIHKINH